jgi:ABC-2 type transport system ATP-binding protein
VAQGTIGELRARRERRLVLVQVRGGSEEWYGSIPGVGLVEVRADGAVLELADDVDEQRVLDLARASGDVVRFGPVHPTLAELFREVVSA